MAVAELFIQKPDKIFSAIANATSESHNSTSANIQPKMCDWFDLESVTEQ